MKFNVNNGIAQPCIQVRGGAALPGRDKPAKAPESGLPKDGADITGSFERAKGNEFAPPSGKLEGQALVETSTEGKSQPAPDPLQAAATSEGLFASSNGTLVMFGESKLFSGDDSRAWDFSGGDIVSHEAAHARLDSVIPARPLSESERAMWGEIFKEYQLSAQPE